jgi:protocatechuate 3,4-dioxygenase alpha subunit
MTARPLTPTQTVGPFFHDCMLRDGARRESIIGGASGAVVRVSGRVMDGDGVGVPDAVIEAWQQERFVRVGTDDDGRYSLEMLRPVPLPFDRTTMQAPHLSVAIFARGLLNHLCTRIYFGDDASTMADPILTYVPEARRSTLIARPDAGGSLTRSYRFDIVLQGEGETVFFDFRT